MNTRRRLDGTTAQRRAVPRVSARQRRSVSGKGATHQPRANRNTYAIELATYVMAPVVKWAAYQSMVGRNRCAQRPQGGRFTRADVDRVLAAAWRSFEALAPDLPNERTVGNRMNMILACMTLAVWRALIADGIEHEYAIELIADGAWQVYEKWGFVPWLAARLWGSNPIERLRIPVNLFLRFPFNAPGYRLKHLPALDGIAFNMQRCPVADYLRAQGAAELCIGSWCNLDYALAEMWGGRLERTGTLAGGDRFCTFRFHASHSA